MTPWRKGIAADVERARRKMNIENPIVINAEIPDPPKSPMYCTFCGGNIKAGETYYECEDDAVCRGCASSYALGKFFESAIQKTAREKE